ncbi:MAG: pyridoxal-phosphate dependent enzyme [Calditrichaeota bacterium]|nr:MAG: pyridoxal-phosphate dependent enzyme [Calditrichota bacterium]
MINLDIHEKQRQNSIVLAREKGIRIPTFEQMINPDKIDTSIKDELKNVGLWEVDPLNLFRISWKNQPQESGGGFGGVNYIELPSSLTGVKARIFGLAGKWFPTGAHKVGAAFGCLVPRLVTGQFDPTTMKAVWPSTGNYCRGGAYNSALLGCESIAILPEGMSRERFEWLEKIAGEVIATPGCESNVKEIYDKCHELRATRDDVMIFNQFDEFGNYLWHYHVTGRAIEEVLQSNLGAETRFAGLVSATGSGGTIACGDYLKQKFPNLKNVASEALQCPTLLLNGYGDHRIEGIGDKHVPWIHNVRNTDMVVAIDDNFPVNLLRLFNEPIGQDYLNELGVPDSTIEQLPLLGISGIANLIGAIKFARYYELTEKDSIFTIFTDSMQLYGSRVQEMEIEFGKYTKENAVRDYYQYLQGVTTDNMLELTYPEKRRIHNLKYFTWIEQQGSELDELNAQWYDFPQYWERIQGMVADIDMQIDSFNKEVGLE